MADASRFHKQLEDARKAVSRARPGSRGDAREATTYGQMEIARATAAVAEATLAVAEALGVAVELALEEEDVQGR